MAAGHPTLTDAQRVEMRQAGHGLLQQCHWLQAAPGEALLLDVLKVGKQERA